MTIKTYRGRSIADVLTQVKSDLGRDAVILHTRTYKAGGWLGIGAHNITEITATSDPHVLPRNPRPGRQSEDRASVPTDPTSLHPSPRSRRPSEHHPPAGDRLDLSPNALRSALGLIPERPVPGAPRHSPDLTDGPAAPPQQRIAEISHTAAPTPSHTPCVAPPAARDVARSIIATPDDAAFRDEMSAIKRMVGQVLQSSRANHQPAMPEALFDCYLRMVQSEVAAELADQIVGAVRDELNAAELRDPAIVRRAVMRRIASHIPVTQDPPLPARDDVGRPFTIALIGPTGVGKTTTIAKLAASYKLRHGKRVALITCDTYRIAAVDQLRTYANIISMPLKVVLTPLEMANACAELADHDAILIDTAGRSQRDASRLDELARFLEAANPHQTHLVLSSTSNESVLRDAVDRFANLKPDHFILTKLDEAVNFGVLLNIAQRISAKLSFVTMGQEVPDHIEHGSADRLAGLVLGTEDSR